MRRYATLTAGPVDDYGDIERRASERVGTVLNNKWTLDRLLGMGGMAAVYAGTHRNKKRGAIKILHLELSTDKFIRERFLREGYIANSVDHPGAVSVNDDDVTEDGSAYLVMELLEGVSLEGPLEGAAVHTSVREEVLELAHQLLDTLAAAHAKGILHRDIKPENLFLTFAGELKVLDFGIARLRQHDSSTPTQTGDIMGTPSYMSPEQARGRWDEVDQRSDPWAVGAVMYTLLTGEVVHRAGTPTEALVKAVTETAPSVADKVPELPASVVAIVDRALAFDKEARFHDASAMRDAVDSAYLEVTGHAVKTLAPAPRRPNESQPLVSRRRRTAHPTPRRDRRSRRELAPQRA